MRERASVDGKRQMRQKETRQEQKGFMGLAIVQNNRYNRKSILTMEQNRTAPE